MAVSYSTATRNAKADAVGTKLSGGTVEIYSGSQPADANTAASGTLLATVTLGTAPAASAGVVTMPDPASVNAVATGTAGWFRAKSSTAATVLDGSVTATGGGGQMQLSSVSLTSGAPVDLSSFTYTEPAS